MALSFCFQRAAEPAVPGQFSTTLAIFCLISWPSAYLWRLVKRSGWAVRGWLALVSLAMSWSVMVSIELSARMSSYYSSSSI